MKQETKRKGNFLNGIMPTECYCSMGKTGHLSEHANGRMNSK